MHSSIYESNLASSSGAIHSTHSKLEIENCIFHKNVVFKGQGGAISLVNGSTSKIILTSFTFNFAKKGGALYTSNASTLLQDCTFSKNNASSGGACVFQNHSTIQVERVVLHENHAHTEFGGSIDMHSESKLYAFNVTITGKFEQHHLYSILQKALCSQTCSIIGNKAKKDGGGIYVSGGSFLNASRMLVTSNSASNLAGGIGIFNNSLFICFSCLFHKNIALNGASIYARSTSQRHFVVAQLQDCRFINNSAGLSGGITHFVDALVL